MAVGISLSTRDRLGVVGCDGRGGQGGGQRGGPASWGEGVRLRLAIPMIAIGRIVPSVIIMDMKANADWGGTLGVWWVDPQGSVYVCWGEGGREGGGGSV